MKETDSDKTLTNETLRNYGRTRLQELKKAKGLTNEKLAEASHLSLNTVKNICQGKSNPNLYTIASICDGLQIPLCEFFAFYPHNFEVPTMYSFLLTYEEFGIVIHFREFNIFQKERLQAIVEFMNKEAKLKKNAGKKSK